MKGEIHPYEVLIFFLERIEKIDPLLNCFITVNENFPEEAKTLNREILQNIRDFPLAGIPVGIKDVLVTKNLRTTAGSKILKNFIPPYDATAVRKIKEAGGIIAGKLNMDEFAMGSSNENSAFGPVRNPHDIERVPGGSSGGSAAAVASGLVPLALGSDTGGSIRQPASFCGIVGLKPTYGRVSRFGLIAFASSLDQVGPMTRNIKDCALLYKVISGFDPHDSTCAEFPPDDLIEEVEKSESLKGLRMGIPFKQLEGIDKAVEDLFKEALKTVEELGAELIEISLPSFRFGIPAYYIIAPSEASSNLARYDGVKYGYRTEEKSALLEMYMKTRGEGFGKEVKRRIMLGTYALSAGYYDAYYLKAQKVRTLIKRDFESAFKDKKIDAILIPASPTPPFRLGEKVKDPLSMYLSDVFTIPVNLAGLPAMSIPCGFTRDRLPVGFQIISDLFQEKIIFKIASAYEKKKKEYFDVVASL